MPDVVLMDVRMPRVDGIEATRRLRAAGFEQLAILMLTTFDLDEYVYEALRPARTASCSRTSRRAELIDGDTHRRRGRLAARAGDHAPADRALRRKRRRPSAGPPLELDALSPRERETCSVLAQGRPTPRSRGSSFVSEATVKTHVAGVLRKLGLRDRVQAVVWAYESGLVRPGERLT